MYCRYIFFADTETCIWRANMDGSNPIKIINTVTDKIKDLAIDFNNSMLYWVDDGMILNSDYNGYNKGSISESVINSSVPSGVSIISGVLYWTQKETELSNGAIFSFALNSNTNVANVVSSNNSSVNHTINPHDISAFMSKEVIASGMRVYNIIMVPSIMVPSIMVPSIMVPSIMYPL